MNETPPQPRRRNITLLCPSSVEEEVTLKIDDNVDMMQLFNKCHI